MKDIKVGDYVRTTRGIAKIKEIQTAQPRMNGKDDIIYKLDKPYIGLSLEDIIKSSFDIIDLIEVGDYVNGYRVVDITIAKYKPASGVEIDCSGQSEDAYLWVDEIKSIVTHEQFESMKYELGDK